MTPTPGGSGSIGTVEVVEVAPRDGLQNEEAELTTEAKVELVGRVLAAGVRRVEVASFVSPRAVPRMAEAEQVLIGLARAGRPEGTSLIGLVVNRRGLDRAVAAGVDEVNAVVVVTDTFSRANQGKTTAESVAELGRLVAAAREAGLRVSVTMAAAFGCPFEGEVPVRHLVEVACGVAQAGPDEVALADTIGVGVPADVVERVTAVREVAGDASLRVHFHNTRNTGIANAAAAVEAGVTAIDASLGGIGGCPFAPAATGNIATEDLVYLLERSGVRTGLDLGRLVAEAAWLGGRLGYRVPGMVSRAGIFPRSSTPG